MSLGLIGIVIPDLVNPFFSELALQVQRSAISAGYNVAIFNTDNSQNSELNVIGLLPITGVVGFVFVSSGDNIESFEAMRDLEIPYVIVDRELPESEHCDFVISDNHAGMELLAKHVISNGHNRVSLITGPANTEPGRVRRSSFVKAVDTLSKGNVVVNNILGDFTFESGFNALQEVRDFKSTVVVACNDLMAIGFLQAAKESGLIIPQDISLTGYDDIPLASWIYPRLTTVMQEVSQMANYAIELLSTRLHNDEANGKVIAPRLKAIKPRLVKRDSCRPL